MLTTLIIIKKEENKMNRGMRPPHPGSMIRDLIEGIKEETGKDLTIRQVAKGLGITPKTLSNILNEHQGISTEMAIRLSEAFGSKPDFWLKLQRDYELWYAEKKVNRAAIEHFLPLPKLAPEVTLQTA
jgi:addiction module HigA family antidote